MSYATIIWILSRIDIILHDYPSTHNTLRTVVDIVKSQLEQEGHTVLIEGHGKIVIDGEFFRIYKTRGLNHYDVRNISA